MSPCMFGVEVNRASLVKISKALAIYQGSNSKKTFKMLRTKY